ncbi:ComEC family competence protein [Patescibacteria group bacterium]|nr:ComEC family competence protein [Patescibacteria group bacterium]
MKRGLTILLLVSFILGVASGPVFSWQNSLVAIWLIGGLVLLAALYRRRYLWFAWGLLSIAVLVIGNLRFGLSNSIKADDVSSLGGQTVELTGVVSTDPQPGATTTKLTVSLLTDANQPAVTGRILVTVPTRPDYEYGNLVQISGQVSRPINRDGFDYAGYLARFGIHATMDYPVIEVTEPFVGSLLLRDLYIVKHRLIKAGQSALPEPAAGLLSGLLFGVKSDLPASLSDNFNRVGLTHIIALSGFNITIIATSLLWLLRFLPLRWRFGLAMAVILLFVLMTGASPSVTRAAIMGILVLLAGLTGRLADSGIALLLAAVAMLLGNPLVLYYDVGFQLSFVATLGIIYLSPVFEDIFKKTPHWLRGYLSPTLAALVFSTPLLVYQFERLSLIAPLSNLLALPVIALAMGLGFAAIAGSLIYPPIGLVIGLLAVWPLNYIIGVANVLASLPVASIAVKVSSAWWVVIAYAILGVSLAFRQSRAPKTDLELHPLTTAS